METTAPIKTAHRNGTLHVDLHGFFDPNIADHLTRRIASEYNGYGNIFIHTDEVTAIHPHGKQALGRLIVYHRLPSQKLYLTGPFGPNLAPDRVKVITHRIRKDGCCGRCRTCNGHGSPKKHGSDEGTNQRQSPLLRDFQTSPPIIR